MTTPTTPQPDGERAQARLDTLRMIAADRMWTQEEFSEACDCVTAGATFKHPASLIASSPALTQAVEAAASEIADLAETACPLSHGNRGISEGEAEAILLRHLTSEWQRVLEVTEDQLRQKNETLRRGSAAMARMSQDNADLRAQLAAAKADGERYRHVLEAARIIESLQPTTGSRSYYQRNQDGSYPTVPFLDIPAAIDSARAQSAGAEREGA